MSTELLPGLRGKLAQHLRLHHHMSYATLRYFAAKLVQLLWCLEEIEMHSLEGV